LQLGSDALARRNFLPQRRLAPAKVPQRQGILTMQRIVPLSVALAVMLAAGTAHADLIHRYSFDGTADDSVGTANGTLVNNATISGGNLVLSNIGASGGSVQYSSLPAGVIATAGGRVTVEEWFSSPGTLSQSATLTPNSLTGLGTTSNYLGRSQYNAYPGFVGTIDEFRIYDSARTASQIATDFSLGPNRVSAVPEPTGWMRLATGSAGAAIAAWRRHRHELSQSQIHGPG
jgi:hypothetical protein